MERRHFIGASIGAGMALLSGCTTASASATPPAVPESALEEGGWNQVDQNEETVYEKRYSEVTVSAVASTRTFEDARLRTRLHEATLETLDARLAVFFASRIGFSPDLDNLPMGVGRKEVLEKVRENAKASFEARMTESGLEDVAVTDEGSFDVDTGETADLVEYEAVYPFDGIEFDVTEDATVTVEGDEITVAGRLAIWNHEGSTLVSGAAYPDENYRKQVDKQLSDAIDLSVDVDLGLAVEAMREEATGLMAGVQ